MKNNLSKKPLSKKLGDKVERIGEKVSDMGDRLEHSKDRKTSKTSTTTKR